MAYKTIRARIAEQMKNKTRATCACGKRLNAKNIKHYINEFGEHVPVCAECLELFERETAASEIMEPIGGWKKQDNTLEGWGKMILKQQQQQPRSTRDALKYKLKKRREVESK